jgi:hypothetical protein
MVSNLRGSTGEREREREREREEEVVNYTYAREE